MRPSLIELARAHIHAGHSMRGVKIPPFHGGRYRYGMTGWVKSVLKNKSEEPFKVSAGIVILGAIMKDRRYVAYTQSQAKSYEK